MRENAALRAANISQCLDLVFCTFFLVKLAWNDHSCDFFLMKIIIFYGYVTRGIVGVVIIHQHLIVMCCCFALKFSRVGNQTELNSFPRQLVIGLIE